jgi:hypothetical protein
MSKNTKETNQASELYELCKEVYEKTKWGTSFEDLEIIKQCVVVPNGKVEDYSSDLVFGEKWGDWLVPLYTSDYLLEKLPAHFYGGTITMTAETDEGPTRYSFFYEDNYETAKVVHCKNVRLQGWDDTPLKALLKLTIALSEAGELDNDQSS